jgi:hypothetical protein
LLAPAPVPVPGAGLSTSSPDPIGLLRRIDREEALIVKSLSRGWTIISPLSLHTSLSPLLFIDSVVTSWLLIHIIVPPSSSSKRMKLNSEIEILVRLTLDWKAEL